MVIERTNSEILIRLSSDMEPETLQRLVDYLKYLEVTSLSKAKQVDIDKLAKGVKLGWWERNKGRLST